MQKDKGGDGKGDGDSFYETIGKFFCLNRKNGSSNGAFRVSPEYNILKQKIDETIQNRHAADLSSDAFALQNQPKFI